MTTILDHKPYVHYRYMLCLSQFPKARRQICMEYRLSYSGGSKFEQWLITMDFAVCIFAVLFKFRSQSFSPPVSLPPFLGHCRFLQCFTVAVLNVEVLKTKHIFLHTLHLAYALPCLAPEPRDQGRYFFPSHHQFLSSDFGASGTAASAGIAPCPTP